jgi:hypothetical protein
MQQPGEYRLESLYGQEPPPEDLVLRGMADLESELTRRFERHHEHQRQARVHQEKVRKPMIDAVSQDPQAAEGVRGLRELETSWRREQEQFLEAAPPQAQEVTQRIFTGSIGATVTAPYDYPWTWSTSTGSPQLSVSADKTTGRMSFDIWNNSNDASGSAAAALGIFFKPMTASGILRLSSNPAFSYYWWTHCAFASAHSDAFIGLYVGRYTLGNSFDGAPVNQEIVLWSDDSWWSGAGSHQGENSGYPLFAQFNVDSSHWYALWVWCGGSASGEGWGVFSGSGADSSMSVALRSITWELFGC